LATSALPWAFWTCIRYLFAHSKIGKGQRLALLPLILIPAFLSLPYRPYTSRKSHHLTHAFQVQRALDSTPVSTSVTSAELAKSTFDTYTSNRPDLAGAVEEAPSRGIPCLTTLRISHILHHPNKYPPCGMDEVVIDILPDDVAPHQRSPWRPLNGCTAREGLNMTFVTFSSS
ncbi:hypothetical protein N7465_000941, partial [Penicillium sp. CMV-2018d]